MSILTIIYVVLVGSIVSGFISYVFSMEAKIPKTIAGLIIGAVLTYVGTINFYMHIQFNKIEALVDAYDNKLSKAENLINHISQGGDDIITSLFSDKIKDINNVLNKIIEQNEFIVDRHEILNIWTKLINSAEKSFYASNLVPPDEWKYVNLDSFGIKPQLQAMKKGVDVKRINLYDEQSKQHKKGMELVSCEQSAKGLISGVRSLQSIKENLTFHSLRQELRTSDVVLVDDKILLLTTVDKNYRMEFAVLSFDKNKIKAARLFFDKIFEGINKMDTNQSASCDYRKVS